MPETKDGNVIEYSCAVGGILICQATDEELGGCDRIHIIEPVVVFDCHNIVACSYLIVTDYGGIQK